MTLTALPQSGSLESPVSTPAALSLAEWVESIPRDAVSGIARCWPLEQFLSNGVLSRRAVNRLTDAIRHQVAVFEPNARRSFARHRDGSI